MKPNHERVAVVVVTRNRRTLLERCLQALEQQTRAPELVIVVDQASDDSTPGYLQQWSAQTRLKTQVVTNANTGGAGGFHRGMQVALADESFEWLWLMDDDAAAQPDCLAHLLNASADQDAMVPWQLDASGASYGPALWKGRFVRVPRAAAPTVAVDTFPFVGPLIRTSMARRIGLPIAEFFIWFDDIEYALRIRRAGGRTLAVRDAEILHDFGQPQPVGPRFLKIRSVAHAPWKIYYGARNHLYALTRPSIDWRGLFFYALAQVKMFARNILVQPRNAPRCAWYQLRGVLDGLRGKLGATILP